VCVCVCVCVCIIKGPYVNKVYVYLMNTVIYQIRSSYCIATRRITQVYGV